MGWATAMVTPGEKGGMDVKSEPMLPIVKIHSCVQSLNTSLLYTYHVPDEPKNPGLLEPDSLVGKLNNRDNMGILVCLRVVSAM